MRAVKVGAYFTPAEYDMLWRYSKAVDRDMAGLVRHALFSLLRGDTQRVDLKYRSLVEITSTACSNCDTMP